ncbi:MAG: hypothetical protein ACKODH_02980 [Limisphaerales bacterium]
MKRSQHIRLVLLGGLSTAAFSVGESSGQIGSHGAYALQGNAFTNDHHLPYAGFYHAPYRGWFVHRYNHFDPDRKQYFHGGLWSDQPHQSITNISTPLPEEVAAALAKQPKPPVQSSTTSTRSGFGSTSHSWGGGWGSIGS